MPDILDKLEGALSEVEDQLLAEFERIRKTLSGEAYSPIDAGVKNALNDVVMDLWHQLEHSGDRKNLTLRTERHETLSVRMIVLKKLLDAKIPTAFLAEAQEEIESARHSVEKKSIPASRNAEPIAETIEDEIGLLEKIMQFFRGKPTPESDTPDSFDPDQEKVEVYLDSVYTTAQHLATLADRFQTIGDDKDMMDAALSDKAVFESRELSSGGQEPEEQGSDEKAQSPEEIRRKLEKSNRQSSGASSFESRELTSAAPAPAQAKQKREVAQTPEAIRKKLSGAGPSAGGASTFESKELSATMPPAAVKPVAEKKSAARKRDVAQTPDEIRRKLEARQGDSGSSGKASFGAKDIEPVAPQVPEKPDRPVKEETEKRPAGKAVFESKDLSTDNN